MDRAPLPRPPDEHWLRVGLWVTAAWLSSCSLTTFDRMECTSDDECAQFPDTSACGAEGYCVPQTIGHCDSSADCRRDVGFGSVCRGGVCEDTTPIDRCADRAYPADLWTDLESHRDRLVFGMLMDHGVDAHVHREDAAELAASNINERRGIDGRRLGLVFCDVLSSNADPYGDGLSREEAAVTSAEWLVDELEVPAIIGPASSGDTTAVYMEVVQNAGGRAVQITPSGTSPALTALDPPKATDEKPGLLWRSAPSAAQQGQLIAEHMRARLDVMIDNVAIIHEEASFGEGVAEAFGNAWRSLDGKFRLFGYAAGDRDELMQRVTDVGQRLDEYQAVFVLGQVDEMTVFMTAATDDAAYGDDLPIYMGDTGVNVEIFKNASSTRLFDNVFAASVALPSTFVFESFQDEFMEEYGVDPADYSFTANAYDALWLMALGAAWDSFQGDGVLRDDGLREVDGLGIARGLRKTVGGETAIRFLPSGWAGAVSQFKAGLAIDARGASGELEFDLDSEEAPGPTALFQASTDKKFTEKSRSE